MKRPVPSLIWGWLLIGAGLFSLLANLDVLGSSEEWIMALVFALGGAGFLALFAVRQDAWWAAIPGFALLGLAVVIGVEMTGIVSDTWSGAAFLGSLSLGFLTVRLRNRSAWWAVIPGGILMSLALIAGLSTTIADERIGGILFAGIALTFGLVYLLGSPHRMTWALIPAGICLVLAAGLLAGMTSAVNFGWPVVLILIGFGLLLRPRLGARTQSESSEGTPTTPLPR